MNIDHNPLQPKWSAGLFQCAEDPGTWDRNFIQPSVGWMKYPPTWVGGNYYPGTCFITCCLPCITFGQIAEVLDGGRSTCITQGFFHGLLRATSCPSWLLSCFYRQKLRSTFGIAGDPCSDCCVHYFCEPCALCQEHAELKHRGLDPSKYYLIGGPNAPPLLPPSMHR